MLRFAEELVVKLKLSDRVAIRRAHLPDESFSADPESFDLVFSVSTLHHFADPLGFWRIVKDYAKADGSIHVFDLVRPLNRDDAREWVGRCADWRFPKVHRDGYFRSFLAAFRPDEVEQHLRIVGLEGVKIEKTDPVHMKIWR
jgi:SAM-dependent methyltransferase